MVLINELIGGFGRYHLFLCVIVFLNKVGVAFHQLAIIFIAPPVEYQCPNNASCCDNPEYDRTKFTRTIVMEWNLICEKTYLKDLTQMVFQFGVLAGSLLFGVASDKYGRRPILIASVVLEVLLGVISCFLPEFWSFTIVRMFLGFSVGGVMVVGFVIVMEYVGNAYRDAISAIYQVPFSFGLILLAVIGYYIRDYIYFLLVISLSNVILLAYICILPESPRWFLAVGKTEKAIALMERVAKFNRLPTQDIRERMELYEFELISGQRRHTKGNIVDLFRTPNLRKNIMIMAFLWLVCSYCFYGTAHYISHLTGDVYINVVASGTVCICACILAIPVIKFFKRKTVVIFANITTSLCLLAIAVVPEGPVSTVFGIFGVLFSYMVFIVVYLYCSEMFPTVVRNAAIGVSSMMARIGSMIAPFVADLRPYGQWCAPVAFGIFPLAAAILCTFLPETKNCELMMTLEEGEALRKRPRPQADEVSNTAATVRFS